MIPLNLPRRSNIVGLWHLDEESGTRYDETSNDCDLTDNATVLYGTGKIGNAADFELANSEYLSAIAAISTHLNFTSGNFSVSFWLKPESLTSHQVFVSRTSSSVNGWQIYYLYDSDVLKLQVSQSGADQVATSNTSLLSAGTLVHIIAVRNGTTGYIYANGADQTASSDTLINPASSSEDFCVGVRSSSLLYYVDGLKDELIIWNTALSPAEALQVKNITAYRYGGNLGIGNPYIF